MTWEMEQDGWELERDPFEDVPWSEPEPDWPAQPLSRWGRFRWWLLRLRIAKRNEAPF